MPELPIICMVCEETVPEAEYNDHMKKHGGVGNQISAISAKKNVPKTRPDLPPGVNPEDLPDPEFLKTMEEMEKEAAKPQQIVTPKPLEQATPNFPAVPVAEVKPIELTYQYIGNCKTCNTPVQTIMVELKDELHAIAFCISHKQQSEMKVWKIGDKI